MTKSELIEKLSQAEGITLKASELAVNITLESMTQAFLRCGRVEIRGFGSFKVNDYDGYSGRNPKTREMVKVKAKKLPVFRVGKGLRERVSGGEERQE